MIPDTDRIVVMMDMGAVEARNLLVWLNHFYSPVHAPKARRKDAGPMLLKRWLRQTVRVNSAFGCRMGVLKLMKSLASSLDVEPNDLGQGESSVVLWHAEELQRLLRMWLLNAFEYFKLTTPAEVPGAPGVTQLVPAVPDKETWDKALRYFHRNGMHLSRCDDTGLWHVRLRGEVYHLIDVDMLAQELEESTVPQMTTTANQPSKEMLASAMSAFNHPEYHMTDDSYDFGEDDEDDEDDVDEDDGDDADEDDDDAVDDPGDPGNAPDDR